MRYKTFITEPTMPGLLDETREELCYYVDYLWNHGLRVCCT